jgi:hypothetical protein
MSGMLRNMSLLKTRLPGLLPKVVWMLICIGCVAIDSASSMKSFALVTSHGGSPCRRVCRSFPTVWCICSQIALTCGFLLDVGASLILYHWRKKWNSGPTNSPPLTCTQHSGQGYLDNQTRAFFLATCVDVFSSILTSSTRLETLSITVKALNFYGLLQTWIIHDSIKSTAHLWMGLNVIHTLVVSHSLSCAT